MNKIKNSEVKKFKEWCCGKDLVNDFICGDIFNKTQKVICDDCLYSLTVRKAKIKSLRGELIKSKVEQLNGERALNFGYNDMREKFIKRIEELENGRG